MSLPFFFFSWGGYGDWGLIGLPSDSQQNIVVNFAEDEIEQYKEAFLDYDKDGSGNISIKGNLNIVIIRVAQQLIMEDSPSCRTWDSHEIIGRSPIFSNLYHKKKF